MNNLAGKKVLCFIALPHHNRFLVPIMEALAGQGMEVVYFTAAAEGSFEITLNQANLPYRHVLDYATPDTKQRVDGAIRQLRPVLQEKLLSSRAIQSTPAVIQDKTIRSAVESFYSLNRMLQVEKPDLLFALHEINPWGKMLGYLSHVHHVPYFTLQEGLYYSDIHYYRFHTDYSTACIVWGQECREVLLKAGCSDDKIYPLGNTHIWSAKNEFMDPAAIQRTRAALSIGQEKKIILFLMAHHYYRPFEAQPFLRWMKERGDVVAVFKWHPVTGNEIIDRAMENLSHNPLILSMHDFDTYALIGASDVCVTVGNSTTGLETLAFGKPLMEVRLPDHGYSYAAQGVAEQAFGFDDISQKIEAILSAGLPPERAANVERYLQRNFAYRDSSTMERIVRLIEESLAARRAEPRMPLRSAGPISVPCSIVLPVDGVSPEALLVTLQAIAANTAAELYEVLIVDCGAREETKSLLALLGGDVKIISGEPNWNYSTACNEAVKEASGKYLLFLKSGMVPESGWLEGLIDVSEKEPDIGIVGGQVLNKNGLLWHVGVAFDVNQSPFSVYRFLPREFSGALIQREFKAVEFPLMISRELFCRLGGLNPGLQNRFEDIDLCLEVKQAGLRILYTPSSKVTLQVATWQPEPEQDKSNRIHFYSKWTGSLWQDDQDHLRQDGLSHDGLATLYRDFAGRFAFAVKELENSIGV